jgi:hypothetical protein
MDGRADRAEELVALIGPASRAAIIGHALDKRSEYEPAF